MAMIQHFFRMEIFSIRVEELITNPTCLWDLVSLANTAPKVALRLFAEVSFSSNFFAMLQQIYS